MTARERALACLNHEPADRLCVGGSFRPEVWEKLKAHFGTASTSAITAELGIGFRGGVGMRPRAEWLERSTNTPLGRGILHEDGSVENEWGVRQIVDGSGPYMRYTHHPLADESALDSYEFPDISAAERWEGVEERVRELKQEHVVSAGTGTFYRDAWGLRGLEQWLCDIAEESAFMLKLLDGMLEYKLEIVRRFARMGVDMISIGGDIALHTGPFMRPDTWRKHFKWRDAALIDAARGHGVEHFFLHSDGNLMPILEDLIEVGFTVLDPVQPECMDPNEVKECYGDRVTLHGTISSQQTLPFGSVESVRAEVRDRVARCGYNNGLVIAPNNVVQFDVPVENLLAVYETVKEIGPDFYQAT
ncbi:MAG: uroporphyrinogen decarboxylase family protein [Armatimonadota bacterium]|jgi:uroporphyrinogen decarboxylase